MCGSRWRAAVAALVSLPLALAASGNAPGFAQGAPAALPESSLIRLSTDPYSNAECLADVHASCQARSEVEPDSLAAGSTIVSAFQVGRFFNGGAANAGFATSQDGGVTWTNGFLPGTTKQATPPGKYDRVSDTSVAYDPKHNVWLISYLGLITPDPTDENSFLVDVLVSRSTDGGKTWDKPVGVDATGTKFLDKSWSVCDTSTSSPFYGNCYTEYDDAGHNDTIQNSTSTDGGLTWGPGQPTGDPPNAFSDPANGGTGGPGAHGLGGQPLVQPNGRVIVPYVNLDVELGFFTFGEGAYVSDNGGLSWSDSVLISEADFHQPNAACPQLAGCGIRADIPLPTAEIDAAGRVYVVWSDCRFQPMCQTSDLVLATSGNGRRWSAVRRIPISAVGSLEDHFLPGLAVDHATAGRDARLALAYYAYPNADCDTAGCELKVGFISSTNGGRSWSSPTQLAGPMKLDWLPDTSQGFMVGDYISTSISPRRGDDAVPVFAVAHRPSGGLLDEATYTTRDQDLAITGGGVPADGSDAESQTEKLISSVRASNGHEDLPGHPRRVHTLH